MNGEIKKENVIVAALACVTGMSFEQTKKALDDFLDERERRIRKEVWCCDVQSDEEPGLRRKLESEPQEMEKNDG